MTLQQQYEWALWLAKKEKFGEMVYLKKDLEIDIDEAIKLLKEGVKNCWYDWSPGRYAISILESHKK